MRILLGIGIGTVAGSAIGYFGKCATGNCPLTMNAYVSAVFAGVVGALLMWQR